MVLIRGGTHVIVAPVTTNCGDLSVKSVKGGASDARFERENDTVFQILIVTD